MPKQSKALTVNNNEANGTNYLGNDETRHHGSRVEVAVKDGDHMTSRGRLAREHWSSWMDFLCSSIGLSVGLGNVWRFPILCYRNGGGAFLVPYILCLACIGFPLFMLQMGIGQYMQMGGIKCWQNLCPLFQGLGVCMAVLMNYANIYYVVIMAWAGYYLVMGWSSVLPWSHCNNTWNTPKHENVDPALEFWRHKILEISDGIDQPGGIVWQLALSLAIMWIICYLSIFYGVRISGKVMYVAAIFPYVVLTILLVRGVTLSGAKQGIIYYLKPDFSRLLTGQVWIDAGTQILYSLGIGGGPIITMSSYNTFKNNFYRDCIIVATINSATSLYAGFAVFSVLGFMAHQQQVNVDKVAEKGPGLAFIAFPKAAAQIPLGPFWASCFFLMIIFLGIGSMIPSVEAVITPIIDVFPSLRKKWKRILFVLCYCILGFCIGLTMVTRGGVYIFQLFDYYAVSGLCLLFICFWQLICISYGFGGWRFYDAIELMLGYRINPYLWVCLSILTPLCSIAIFIFEMATFKLLVYDDTYEYPLWVNYLGIAGLAGSVVVALPIVAVVRLLSTGGSLTKRFKDSVKPHLRQEQISPKWKPEEIDSDIPLTSVELTKYKNQAVSLLADPK